MILIYLEINYIKTQEKNIQAFKSLFLLMCYIQFYDFDKFFKPTFILRVITEEYKMSKKYSRLPRFNLLFKRVKRHGWLEQVG